MFKIDKYRIDVEVNLENGVYIFDGYSSTGKTYLYKLAEKYRHYGEKIVGYTYNDFIDSVNIDKVLDNTKYKLAVLDRYDMYYGEGIKAIQEFAKNGIVLVDTKRGVIPPNESKPCYLYLSGLKILVSKEWQDD